MYISTLASHLQDPFVVPALLLLAVVAQRRLDAQPRAEPLDGLEVLEAADGFDRQRKVVRILFARDEGEGDPLERSLGGDAFAEQPRGREIPVELRPAGSEPERTAGGASLDVDDLRGADDRVFLREVLGA